MYSLHFLKHEWYNFNEVVSLAGAVYLSLNNDIIPNHSYVVISDIGSAGDDTALICHTNRPATVSGGVGYFHSGGHWFGPNGMFVGGATIGVNNVPGFRRNRDPMILRLYRNTDSDPPLQGIFHCEVEDNTSTQQTVYVGVYGSGGGMAPSQIRCYVVHFFTRFFFQVM